MTERNLTETDSGRKPRRPGWFFAGMLVLTLGYLGAFSFLYETRPDAYMAVTVYPIWVWTIPPIFLFGIISRCGLRHFGSLLIPCLVVTWIYADTPLSLVRTLYHEAPPEVRPEDDSSLRVITLNAQHAEVAIAALARYKPDIILIQETVARDRLGDVCRTIFGESGHASWDVDLSILSRFPIRREEPLLHYPGYCIASRIEIPESYGASELLVAPLHLNSPPFRLDLWEKECWTEYREHREAQQKQFRSIIESFPEFTADEPVMIAGDFNAPPGDAIFDEMPASLRDTFRQVGVGWGCTIANELPLIRIDQLWTTPVLKPLRCHAVFSEGSDHRAVIADYEIVAENEGTKESQ